MVDSISQFGALPGIRKPAQDSSKTQISRGNTSGETPSAIASGDVTEISASVVKGNALPEKLTAGPPIEMALVTQLQEKIKNGEYPIDLDAITDSLFESYLELNS